MKSRNVAIYQYISELEQQTETYYYEQALIDIRDFCEEKKFDIYWEYVDCEEERVALNELLKDMKKNKFSYIIVSNVIKLADTKSDIDNIVKIINSYGTIIKEIY